MQKNVPPPRICCSLIFLPPCIGNCRMIRHCRIRIIRPDNPAKKKPDPDYPDIRQIAISGRIISGNRISGKTLVKIVEFKSTISSIEIHEFVTYYTISSIKSSKSLPHFLMYSEQRKNVTSSNANYLKPLPPLIAHGAEDLLRIVWYGGRVFVPRGLEAEL